MNNLHTRRICFSSFVESQDEHFSVQFEASNNIHALLGDMCVPLKNVINISENEEEIIRTVPKATEEICWVDRSEEDIAFVTTMMSFLRETLRIYHEHLNNLGIFEFLPCTGEPKLSFDSSIKKKIVRLLIRAF